MPTEFKHAKLILSHWIPMGVNNLVALNRHLGAHKGYAAPTAFGMKGAVKNLNEGKVKMDGTGILLRPTDFHFSTFLKAEMANSQQPDKIKGLEIQKDGSCYVGLSFKEPVSITDMKKILGEVESEFAHDFLPILTENQLSLLRTSYGVKTNELLKKSTSTYGLVLTDSLGVQISSTKQFLANADTKNIITPLTDWVVDHFSKNNCHVFIGMRAMVCVGEPDNALFADLKRILFLRTLFNLSLRLHSVIWQHTKSLEKISTKIPSSSYKELKQYNYDFSELQNTFSRLQIVCSKIRNTIEAKCHDFKAHSDTSTAYYNKLNLAFNEEKEKSDDRLMIIKQLNLDLKGLRDQLQQKSSLIMTKSSQRLNIILLVLTVISVTSVGQILGFSLKMIVFGSFIVTPFIYIAIKNYLQYRKDFEDEK